MNRVSAYIRLPDGTVRYSLYEGTSDHFYRQTYETLDAAWNDYIEHVEVKCACSSLVLAEYWQGYGAGHATVVDYCHECKRLKPKPGDFFEHMNTVGVDLEGDEYHDGWVRQSSMPEWWIPSWVVAAHHGEPE